MMTTATERVMETMVRDGVPCRCSLCADIRAALDEAVAAERARCAAVCRARAVEYGSMVMRGDVMARACAEAIERGEAGR